MRLESGLAAAFARVAIANIKRPLPHKFDHLLLAGADTRPLDHVSLHPAFFGSYDWHSAVHMHWLLVRVLRLQPLAAAEAGAANLLDDQLTAENLAVELAYCAGPAGKTSASPPPNTAPSRASVRRRRSRPSSMPFRKISKSAARPACRCAKCCASAAPCA